MPAKIPARSRAAVRTTIAALLVAAAGILLVTYLANTQGSPGASAGQSSQDASSQESVPGTAPTAGTALAVLATIPVKGKAPHTGYDRVGDFGAAWKDVDGNGCDTRDDVLARDLTDVVRNGQCKVLSGVLRDPYSGKTIDFVRGERTSALVQIDHVVPLSNAWQTGARQLTQQQREALANDPLELLAVDGPTNESKGDGDAATWLPANRSFRCAYAARQVSVKAAYRLWVVPAEHDALARILNGCPAQPALTSTLAPTVGLG